MMVAVDPHYRPGHSPDERTNMYPQDLTKMKNPQMGREE